jgi:hypothetical protein
MLIWLMDMALFHLLAGGTLTGTQFRGFVNLVVFAGFPLLLIVPLVHAPLLRWANRRLVGATWVLDDSDYDRAVKLIATCRAEMQTIADERDVWRCGCGEENEGQFVECWNFGKPRR